MTFCRKTIFLSVFAGKSVLKTIFVGAICCLSAGRRCFTNSNFTMRLNVRRLFVALLCSCAFCVAGAQTSTSGFDFALRLLRQHRLEQPGSNLCLSPLSLEMAMGMAANGAAGSTRREIKEAMGWGSMSMSQFDHRQQQLLQQLQSGEDITVELANSVWINKQAGSVKRSFVKANKSYFNAEVTRLPFNASATERINRWCAAHTQDKITNIVEQVDAAVQMYLINALYFKGTWLNRFNEAVTRSDLFNTAHDGGVSVRMMHQQSYFEYAEQPEGQLVEMPFVCVGEQQYSFYVLLPAEGTTADAVLDSLSGTKWQQWIDALRSQEVNLSLPKFRMEYAAQLNTTLQALGIKRAFGAEADFSGISQKPLAIDVVLQKTYLDVTETGAEAAAVTAIAMMRATAMQAPKVKVMRVDRPFLFCLAEKKSGTVLFVGKVENPALFEQK